MPPTPVSTVVSRLCAAFGWLAWVAGGIAILVAGSRWWQWVDLGLPLVFGAAFFFVIGLVFGFAAKMGTTSKASAQWSVGPNALGLLACLVGLLGAWVAYVSMSDF